MVRAAAAVKVKVITENCYLTQEEKRRACEWIAQTGAHFVKTSTAYADGGATLDDVRLMYEAVRGKCLVKAGWRDSTDTRGVGVPQGRRAPFWLDPDRRLRARVPRIAHRRKSVLCGLPAEDARTDSRSGLTYSA